MGLYVRPYQMSVSLAPPDRGKSMVFNVRPVAGGGAGGCR